MNDETNQQDSKNNIYQGNYDNDYKDNLNAIPVSLGGNLSNYIQAETPKYMNLGAPRERDDEDAAHHQKNMQKLFGEDNLINFSTLGFTQKRKEVLLAPPAPAGAISKFLAKYLNLHLKGPHFKLLKTDTVGPYSLGSKIKWGLIVILLAVSVSSFLTQSVLFVKDALWGNGNMSVVDLNSQQTNLVQASSESKGSDDGINSTSSKIGGAPKYRLNDATRFPTLSAKSFLVADLTTGEIIKQSQDVGKYPLASMSKLMTGLVAYQKMDPKTMAIVSRSSYNTYGTQGELLLGESIRVSDLMYPLLMESSNDGAEVLADAYGHDKFMVEMNKKAAELGMSDTYYNDPSGLDPKNVSTVDDQFKLARYIYENAPVIFDLTRVRQFEILKHRWYSKNAMLNIPEFIGGKNGFIDESRQTAACLFDIQMAKGGKRKIAIVVLRTNDREGDVVKILNFLKKNGYYEEDWTGTGIER